MNRSNREILVASAKLVVVKVGTRVLSDKNGRLDLRQVESLADQIRMLRTQDRQVVLVSSGAVGAGISHLGLNRRPTDLAMLQAVAAVGQTKLIEAYDRFLKQHGYTAAQVLLTADGLDDRSRYLNVRNTLRSLLDIGAIPIINENDTVAVEELQTTFGDNDRLAALVTNLLAAPLLVILSDVSGLYDGPPERDGSKLLDTVTVIDDSVRKMVMDESNDLSKGGMSSKLAAAQIVTSAGENVILASGHEPGILARIFDGENVGTFFPASEKGISPYKRWISFSAQTRGRITLDAGASTAVIDNGGSVLAIGVTDVDGEFLKGDPIDVLNQVGERIARGLTNYSSNELQVIQGVRSSEIADKLGHRPYETVIHRDNLSVAKKQNSQ